jgi:hypothetical protein
VDAGSEATEEEPSVAGAFRDVYRFILRAMQEDADAASAMFQRSGWRATGGIARFIASLRAGGPNSEPCAPRASLESAVDVCTPTKGQPKPRPLQSSTSTRSSIGGW